MQLSVPSIPITPNAAPSSAPSAGKPATTTANDSGFGDLLNAETKSLPSPRQDGTAAAKGRLQAAAQLSSKLTVATESVSLAIDEVVPPADENSTSRPEDASWLLAANVVPGPTVTNDVSAITINLPFSTGEAQLRPEDSVDATDDESSVSTGLGTATVAPTDLIGRRTSESVIGQTPVNARSSQNQRTERPTLGDVSSFPATAEPQTVLTTDTVAQPPAANARGFREVKASQSEVPPTTAVSVDRSAAMQPAVTTTPLTGTAPTTSFTADTTQETEPNSVPPEVPVSDDNLVQAELPARGGADPRGASASANALRVHAAINEARAADAPPGAFVAEKFAGRAEQFSESLKVTEVRGQRKTLTVDPKEVEARYTPVGINVAKAVSSMPAPATFTPPPSGAAESMSFAASPLTFDSLVNTDTEHAALVSGARRAVESAVTATERLTTTDRSSVNLQFKVSGVELSVRVEMRADGVHTTFRTDSPELRAALAQEWQSVAAQTPERTVRLAEPTFTANSSGGGLQSDTSSAHQRQSSAREPETFSGQLNTGRTASRAQPVAVTKTSLPVATPAASGRLHTFA